MIDAPELKVIQSEVEGAYTDSPKTVAKASDSNSLSSENAYELIDFNNTQIAFEYKSDHALKKALFLFNSIKYNFLVKLGPPLVSTALEFNLPIDQLVKKYFFDQFCGGLELEATMPVAQLLYRYGVSSTLDYSVEANKTELGFNACMNEIYRMLEYAQKHEEIHFVAMKVTGIGSFDVLAKAQRGKLSHFEQTQFDAIYDRLDKICNRASELGQSILIDAEETWIQNPIDQLAEEMIFKYNKDYPVVYTTAQMYRKDRFDYIKELFLKARRRRSIPAVKLVRGAYVEKENLRARQLHYATPLNPSKAMTDIHYNKAALYILERIDKFALYAGTHNEESCQLIARNMFEKDISIDHPFICFSQLYGMSDHISFNLSKRGYRVSKYLPYGPLKAVMPYLFRRAQENTSIAGQSGRELTLIEKELHRRKIANAKGIL